ncbi:MAG: TrbI/VirB10 family protein [Brevundimonas sp.]
MTGFTTEDRGGRQTPPPGPSKAPPPDLLMRAAPPPAIRLRGAVVRMIGIGGVVVVSGALTWAFVVQPELRAKALARAAETREEEGRGAVRPAEAVTDQPASYDRLPPPRGAAAEPETVGAAPGPEPVRVTAGPATRRTHQDRGPSPGELAARSGLFFDPPLGAATPGTDSGGAARTRAHSGDREAIYNAHSLTAPLSPYEIKAGAILPAVLLTGVDTERAGPVVATISQNVFDTVSGRHLVLPQGTRLIGRHEGDSAYGDRRAVLVWDRLILPNGKSLLLSQEPGVDAQGVVGVRGAVDRRLVPLAIGALFAGAITTLGQVARDRDGGATAGFVSDAGNAAAIEGAQVGGRLIDRELQVRPSIRLRPGAPVRVMITRDLILEPYRP